MSLTTENNTPLQPDLTEKKPLENAQTTPTGAIDFSKFDFHANAGASKTPTPGNIQIIDNTKTPRNTSAAFMNTVGQQVLKSVGRINPTTFWFFCGIGVVIGVLSYFVNEYIYAASQRVIDPTQQEFITQFKEYEKMANDTFKFTSPGNYQSLQLIGNEAQTNLSTIIDAQDINYIQKKEFITAGLASLAQAYSTTSTSLDQIKKDIGTYGGISKEGFDILAYGNQDIAIQESLLTVEVIKFTTAVKVFYYLDTFIQEFAQVSGISRADVLKKMEALIQKGEPDIEQFIRSCYMNPFEKDGNCGVTADFDKRYASRGTNKETVDAKFIKQLLSYIDQKLENSSLPSLAITFNNFDPQSEVLTLNIEVNTFPEDEVALLNKGVLNPHIFVVTNLINLLRQSRFIQGEAIDVKNLKINKKKVRVGTNEFVANSSNFSFTVPIQKATQRDISDYYNP